MSLVMVTPAVDDDFLPASNNNAAGTNNNNNHHTAPTQPPQPPEAPSWPYPQLQYQASGSSGKPALVLGRMHSEPERSLPLVEFKTLEPPAPPNYRSCPEIGPQIQVVQFTGPGVSEEDECCPGYDVDAGGEDGGFRRSSAWGAPGGAPPAGRAACEPAAAPSQQRPHLWTPHTRLGLSARLEHSFLTRTVSRESVRCSATDAGLLPASSSQQPSSHQAAGAPLTTSLRQLHRDNEIAEIAADSMRINGALRHFKHLRKPTSTLSIPAAMKVRNARGLVDAAATCHPHHHAQQPQPRHTTCPRTQQNARPSTAAPQSASRRVPASVRGSRFALGSRRQKSKDSCGT